MAEPKDIIILSIGPVQSYISAARRTQDLHTASQILSVLAQSACAEARNLNCEIIYPQIPAGNAGVPNRIVLIAPEGQGKSIAEKACAAVESKRTSFSESAKTYINQKVSGVSFDTNLWDAQVKDWLELYWVVVPWDGDESTYSKQLHVAGLGLDGRKSVRKYPSAQEKNDPCTLCGSRSSLGGREFWSKLKIGGHHIQPNERFCAVCAIKRLLPVTPARLISSGGFPSTASIASASYRGEIKKYWAAGTCSLVKDLVHAIIELHLDVGQDGSTEENFEKIDGAYFYLDFYQHDRIQKETGLSPEPVKLFEARRAISELNQKLTALGSSAPHAHAYYAILLIDGDHMGKLLDRAVKKDDHIRISAALAELAVSAKRIVEGRLGKVVYSGGDDLMALLPVDTVLMTAFEIQAAFQKKLLETGYPGMSASAGIAIAHYNAPLQTTIDSARMAERDAKSSCGRNALVLRVSKRSGEIRRAAIKWSSATGVSVPLAKFQMFVQAIANEDISGKLAYELSEEIPALSDTFDHHSSSLFSKELYRLLKRHSSHEYQKNNDLATLADEISSLWDFVAYDKLSKVEQIVQWLLVARFLAQGEQL